MFADAEGNIAYFHANYVPIRDTRFDWTEPVDGNDPATAWQGLHAVDDSPLVVNPASGWTYCTNNWPYSAAGSDSPRQSDYPAYMDGGSENYRGIHAIMLLDAGDRIVIHPGRVLEVADDLSARVQCQYESVA